MTDDEMRMLLAERIMGWHQDKWTYRIWWTDTDTMPQLLVENWHPETDLEQAMKIAETLRLKHGWEYVIMAITPRQAGWTVYKGEFSCRFNWFGRSAEEYRCSPLRYDSYKANVDALPRAIFLAATQVAEAMEVSA